MSGVEIIHGDALNVLPRLRGRVMPGAPMPARPLALDLFCGAGGASLGLRAAGEESCKRLKRYFS